MVIVTQEFINSLSFEEAWFHITQAIVNLHFSELALPDISNGIYNTPHVQLVTSRFWEFTDGSCTPSYENYRLFIDVQKIQIHNLAHRLVELGVFRQ
jgi:hypothetical protein